MDSGGCVQEKQQEMKEQQGELRLQLLAAGNAAAADALRVQQIGFMWACDFKELSLDVTAERIYEELSAANTAHALPINFSAVPEASSMP